MKKTRKLLSLLLALAMLLSLLPTAALAAGEDYTVTLLPSAASVVQGGDFTVAVDVNSTAKTSYNYAQLTVTYDKNIVSYTGATQAEGLEVTGGDGGILITVYGDGKGLGTLVTLSFTANAMGSAGLGVAAGPIVGEANSDDASIAAIGSFSDVTVTGRVATPTVSRTSFQVDSTATLSCQTDGAEIYYTLDESNPADPDNVGRIKYEEPFGITASCTLKAVAVKDGMADSELLEKALTYDNNCLLYIKSVDADTGKTGINCGNVKYGKNANLTGAVTTNSIDYVPHFSVTANTTSSVGYYFSFDINPAWYELVSVTGEGCEVYETSEGSGIYTVRNVTAAEAYLVVTTRQVYYQVSFDEQQVHGSISVYKLNYSTEAAITSGEKCSAATDTYIRVYPAPDMGYAVKRVYAEKAGGGTVDFSKSTVANYYYYELSKIGDDCTIYAEFEEAKTAAPTVSAVSAAYGGTITLTCATANSTIYYTTDGTDPTESSTRYTAPIPVTGDFTLKAMAVCATEGYEASGVQTWEIKLAPSKLSFSVDNWNGVTLTNSAGSSVSGTWQGDIDYGTGVLSFTLTAKTNYEITDVTGTNCTVDYTGDTLTVSNVTAAAATVTVTVAVNADAVWDGTSAATDWMGSGTAEDPYLITKAAQLAGLSKSVSGGNSYSGKYFKLGNDLDLGDMEWTPIGTEDTPFAGLFDGGGFSISNLKVSATAKVGGLFGYQSGTIQNLIIASGSVGATSYAGSVAAYSTGGIYSCANLGCTVGSTQGRAGGIVGGNLGSAAVVADCYNRAKVESLATTYNPSNQMGGVVGESSGAMLCCYNTGAVIGKTYTKDNVLNTAGKMGGYVLGVRLTGATIYNVFYSTTCVSASKGVSDTYGVRAEDADMTVSGWVETLNGDIGRAFVADTGSINGGYPILRCQTAGGDTATITGFAIETPPTLVEYDDGERFDAAGVEIRASYSDGTSAVVYGYQVDKEGVALGLSDTKVTFSGVFHGQAYSLEQSITVNAEVMIEFGIVDPDNGTYRSVYLKGEKFDPGAMRAGYVTTYAYGTLYEVESQDKLTFSPSLDTVYSDPGTYDITVSYTHGDVTLSQTIQITVLESDKAPVLGSDGYYQIETTDDLMWFAAQVNSGNFSINARLMNDIDMTEMDERWIPIGAGGYGSIYGLSRTNDYGSVANFSGTLDGNGMAVTLALDDGDGPAYSNPSYHSPLALLGFGTGATVEDLTVKGSVTVTHTAYGFAAVNVAAAIMCSGDVNSVLRNCVNYASVINTASSGSAGGIAGQFNGTIENCSNYGTVSGQASAGGIGAKISGSVLRSYNYSAISGGSGTGGVGGIAGSVSHAEECVNYGSVTASGSSSLTGGIAGQMIDANNDSVSKCANFGSVSASGSNTGGVIGRVYGMLEQCYNTGTVNAESGYAGGVAGGIQGWTAPYSTIQYCYNRGDVTNTNGSAGGILGEITSSNSTLISEISSCYNTGLVTAGKYAGGVMATSSYSHNFSITNCYYLAGSAESGFGNTTLITDDDIAVEKSSDEMKALADTLSSVYFTADVKNVNDGYPILDWSAKVQYTVSFTGDNAVAKVDGVVVGSFKVTAGEDLTFTVEAAEGFTVTGVSVDGAKLNANADGSYTISAVSQNMTVTMLAGIVTSGDNQSSEFVSTGVWDGTVIDVSWYNTVDTVFYISTPEQLMGLAAIVNGLYNKEIKTIVGDASCIVAYQAVGTTGANNMSTTTYWYGGDDFNGKTVILTEDIDMGGVYDTTTDTWTGPNFMPIGGQYLMTKNDSTTKLSSSFCGTFDGGGHYIYNIYCDRHCSTGNYGDGASVGLIGRLGVHDGDPVSIRPVDPTVKNVAVTGYIFANRSVGGIVGKIGKTSYNNGDDSTGGIIENCANFARIVSTDAKGAGGICGASLNGGIIRNCYNAGDITGGWPAGGIAGANEITLENCYSYGYVDSTHGDNYGEGIGTNNTGAPYSTHVLNCWYRAGSSSDGGYWSNGTSNIEGALSEEFMKSEEFLTYLYEGTFASDESKINNGYPVLAWQASPGAQESTGGGGGSLGETNVPSVAETTTTVEDGAATVTVDGDALTEAAETADENTRFVISGELEGETVTSVTTVIPMPAVKAVADSGASIQVQTPLGDVDLSNGALKDLATRDGENLIVTVEAKADGTTAITIAVDDTAVDAVSGGLLAVIPAKSGNVAVLVNPDGSETVIPKSIVENGTAYVLLPGSAVVKVIDNVKSFTDVKDSDWYSSYVDFASSHELFNGVGDSQFAPDASMTRAMLVTVLHRLEGTPKAGAAASFDDVPAGTWYTEAVAWASGNGIVEGYGNGLFGPEENVTREQMAAILYRYMQYLGLDVSARGDLNGFSDGGQTSAWASDAMQWAVGAGILIGDDNNALNPTGTATRAEVATMLMRFVSLMVKGSAD